MLIWKGHLTLVKDVNENCILERLMVCDDGLEVVFVRLVSTDKQDSVASQDSNATINPLLIIVNTKDSPKSLTLTKLQFL